MFKRGLFLLLGGFGFACLHGCTVTVAPNPPPVVYSPPPPPPYRYQAPPPPPPSPAPETAAPAQADPQLDQLVAPIALYPDPLLAQLLPAATYPDQVQQAYQFVSANPNPTDEAIDSQPWAQNPNIKAMAHYPDALKVLASDPQWAQSLGSAFNSDPKGVMAAIQDMRAQAQAAGNLKVGATPQVNVVADAGVISIQPVTVTAPLYVPVYDPVVVYTSPVVVTWGPGYVVGPWLTCGVDWYGGGIFIGSWWGPWWHGGHWGYWHGWHADHWYYHNYHWGRPPYVARAHWAVAPGIRGREAAFHHAVDMHRVAVDHYRAPARSMAVHADPKAAHPGAAPEHGRTSQSGHTAAPGHAEPDDEHHH